MRLGIMTMHQPANDQSWGFGSVRPLLVHISKFGTAHSVAVMVGVAMVTVDVIDSTIVDGMMSN